jgi:hypothetical protein
MCGSRHNFAKGTQTVKWFAGNAPVKPNDVTWVSGAEFKRAFPSEARGFCYDFMKSIPIADSREYAIGAVGSSVRPITRRVVFVETDKPTKCGAMCRNAKGSMCDCSCKGDNHGAGVAMSRTRFAAPKRAHNISLPRTKRRLNIDEASAALSQMGYRLGNVRYDAATSASIYKITQPNGAVVEVPATKISDFVYGKIKDLNMKNGTKAAFAANNVDLWNFLSKSDFIIARQNANDLANLKKYASMALTMPDFTPPSHQQHGPSLHAMAKNTLADIKKWEQSVYTYKNRAPWSRSGAKAAFSESSAWIAKYLPALNQWWRDRTDHPTDLDASSDRWEIEGVLDDVAEHCREAVPREAKPSWYAAALRDVKKIQHSRKASMKSHFAVTTYEQAEYQIALAEERTESMKRRIADRQKWLDRANGLMHKADAGDMKAQKEVMQIANLLESTMRGGFSRTGAKAAFAMRKTVTVQTLLGGTGGSGGVFKVVGYDENGKEFEYGMFAMRSMAEEKARWVARIQDWSFKASRTGAKANMGVSRVTPTNKTEAGGGTWTTKSVPYGGKKATVEFYNKNGLVGSVYQDPDNPAQYKAFNESSGSEIASGSRAACKAAVEKIAMSRTGAKAAFGLGSQNRAFLGKVDARTRSEILANIAAHYGISASEAMAEVTSDESEHLLEYVTGAMRPAVSVLVQKHGFARTGAKALNTQGANPARGTYPTSSGASSSRLFSLQQEPNGNLVICKGEAARGSNKVLRVGDMQSMRQELREMSDTDNFSRTGAKSTHAANAVSSKIATLVREGYDQTQAAAIAYDMKRRGEL